MREVFRCGSAESITRRFYSRVQGLIFTKSHLKARLHASAAVYDPSDTTRRFLVHRPYPTRRREDESRDCWTGSRSRFSSSTSDARLSSLGRGDRERRSRRLARGPRPSDDRHPSRRRACPSPARRSPTALRLCCSTHTGSKPILQTTRSGEPRRGQNCRTRNEVFPFAARKKTDDRMC